MLQIDHSLIDSENPLLKRMTPILLQIFCVGVQSAPRSRICLASAVALLFMPVSFVFFLISKWVHFVLLALIWIIALAYFPELIAYLPVIFAAVLLIIFYKDLYAELKNFFFAFINLVTLGELVRWIARGYLNRNMFFLHLMDKEPAVYQFVGTAVEALEPKYRLRYQSFMDLYFESENEDFRNRLIRLMDGFDMNNVLSDKLI